MDSKSLEREKEQERKQSVYYMKLLLANNLCVELKNISAINGDINCYKIKKMKKDPALTFRQSIVRSLYSHFGQLVLIVRMTTLYVFLFFLYLFWTPGGSRKGPIK